MKLLKWLFAVALIAAVTHGALLYFGPSLVMSRLLGRMADRAGGFNAMVHMPRPNAANDTVVRSSPDLLYSACPYDLSAGQLRVTADVPQGTYWSMSFYDANTNNYRVINDSQATAGAVLIVLRSNSADLPPAGAEVVTSPTKRGVVLIRTLINDDARLADIDQVRRTAKCVAF